MRSTVVFKLISWGETLIKKGQGFYFVWSG